MPPKLPPGNPYTSIIGFQDLIILWIKTETPNCHNDLHKMWLLIFTYIDLYQNKNSEVKQFDSFKL